MGGYIPLPRILATDLCISAVSGPDISSRSICINRSALRCVALECAAMVPN